MQAPTSLAPVLRIDRVIAQASKGSRTHLTLETRGGEADRAVVLLLSGRFNLFYRHTRLLLYRFWMSFGGVSPASQPRLTVAFNKPLQLLSILLYSGQAPSSR